MPVRPPSSSDPARSLSAADTPTLHPHPYKISNISQSSSRAAPQPLRKSSLEAKDWPLSSFDEGLYTQDRLMIPQVIDFALGS
ncbi:hypothetical protein BDR22DRAFT_863773 [Usnea florida]